MTPWNGDTVRDARPLAMSPSAMRATSLASLVLSCGLWVCEHPGGDDAPGPTVTTATGGIMITPLTRRFLSRFLWFKLPALGGILWDIHLLPSRLDVRNSWHGTR